MLHLKVVAFDLEIHMIPCCYRFPVFFVLILEKNFPKRKKYVKSHK